MSTNWVADLAYMHQVYKFHDSIKDFDQEKLKTLLEFRLKFVEEEAKELRAAVESGNKEEVVDALIDICVVAIGTLDLFEIDSQKAWRRVLMANLSKQTGIKPSRPNPLGMPDLIKPDGWTAPHHEDNTGRLP